MEDKKCRVYLISGFLGSGKTTMLSHLLKTAPDGERIAVLMNEFGKAGVDGDVVRKDGLDIIEISRGSIFCACAKGDFLRALYTIFRDYKPTVLLIEASGVADTTDMERDLGHGMLHDYYRLCGNICLVDAKRFKDWADIFCAVPKQIEAASAIVINKIDTATQEELDETERQIREINPRAKIMRASYGRIPWEAISGEHEKTEPAPPLPASEEWERYIEAVLNDMTRHLAPPDKLASMSVFWEGPAERFKELLHLLPDDIVRAKGYFLDTDGKWKVFNIVGNEPPVYSEPAEGFNQKRNLAVFIRTKRARHEIPDLFQNQGLKLLEVRFG